MPKIGKPQAEKNLYSNIKLKRAKALTNGANAKSIGEQLNNVSGRKEDARYVDKATHNKMGKDSFLKLLTNQLSNQDPMKPMDQKDFAADLAQFSQLEQLTNMNKQMEIQTNTIPSESKFYGASFLGKEVITAGTSLKYSGSGETIGIPFHLEKDAKNVFIRIYDSKDQMVAQLAKEGMSSGSQNVVWDGTSRDGTNAPKDTYRVEVIAYDNQLEEFFGKTSTTGTVSGVKFENGETILIVDKEKRIFLRDVQSFKLPSHNQSAIASKNIKQAQKEFQKNMMQ